MKVLTIYDGVVRTLAAASNATEGLQRWIRRFAELLDSNDFSTFDASPLLSSCRNHVSAQFSQSLDYVFIAASQVKTKLDSMQP